MGWLYLDDYLPVNFDFDEIFDNSIYQKRINALTRDLGIIREIYKFSSDEIKSAPFLYRIHRMIAYNPWQIKECAGDDDEKAEAILDHIIRMLSDDTIDFESILSVKYFYKNLPITKSFRMTKKKSLTGHFVKK